MERTPGRLRLLRERARDDEAIEEMNEAAFGPDRTHKTVYRLREDVKPIKELCFVAIDQKGRMVASIRNWPILINERWPAILLGPLAISPELRGLGYGKALMWHSMAQSRMLGHSRIILVGDPEYYNQFGFRRDLALNIQLPGLGRGAAVPGARAGRRLDDRRARHDRQMGRAQAPPARSARNALLNRHARLSASSRASRVPRSDEMRDRALISAPRSSAPRAARAGWP